MKATGLYENRHALERAGHQLSLVARDARLREAGNGAVEDANRVGDCVREKPQARAQDDRDARFERAQTFAYRRDGRTRPSLVPLPHQSRMPASVAERKLASVPAIMARKPSRARACLRSGASAPMPPIWMPIELRLANPPSAKVAIVKDTGSRLAFIGPRCA